MENSIGRFLMFLALQSPLLLVYALGIVLALLWFARSPSASLLAIVGCVLLLGNAICALAVRICGASLLMDHGNFEDPSLALERFHNIITFVSGLIQATAILLLLLAIFRGRDANMPSPLPYK